MTTHILPNTLTIRHPTMDDLQAVTDLINACDIAEHGAPEMTVDDLHSYWRIEDFNLATDAWVVAAQDGHIVGYEEGQWNPDVARVDADGYVHPDYENMGIGTYLLSQVEAWAGEHNGDVSEGQHIRIHAGVSGVNQAAHQLFEGVGYHIVRVFWRMQIDMQEMPTAPVWPDGITIRSLVSGQDEFAAYTAVDEAFRDHWEHVTHPFEEWKQFQMERESFDPTLWFLAFAGAEPAGAALCSVRPDGSGWVRTLAVRRPWRKQGLGMALLLHAFGEFYRRGIHEVALGVDAQNLTGATRLYERAGMHMHRRYDTYEKIVP